MTELVDRWAGAEWRAEAQAWIGVVLDSYGLKQTEATEQPPFKFWSTMLVIPTDHGKLWFKENNPGQFSEALVVSAMAELVPEHVVMPLAIEPERGWMLSPDHGATLATLKSTDDNLWSRVVSDFADLQLQLIPHEEKLFQSGLFTLDPASAANRVENQLRMHAMMPADHPIHLGADEIASITAELPEISAAADALASVGIPLTLEHNDLHHNNAFIPGSSTEPLKYFDFADSFRAHPLSSMLVPLNVMMEEWRAPANDPRIRRVMNAYLECWTQYAPITELRYMLEPAMCFARLNRYASWMRLLQQADERNLRRYGPKMLDNLRNLLKPLGVF